MPASQQQSFYLQNLKVGRGLHSWSHISAGLGTADYMRYNNNEMYIIHGLYPNPQ